MSKSENVGLKHVTKLPDHDHKAKLTDLTMADRDDDVAINI